MYHGLQEVALADHERIRLLVIWLMAYCTASTQLNVSELDGPGKSLIKVLYNLDHLKYIFFLFPTTMEHYGLMPNLEHVETDSVLAI